MRSYRRRRPSRHREIVDCMVVAFNTLQVIDKTEEQIPPQLLVFHL